MFYINAEKCIVHDVVGTGVFATEYVARGQKICSYEGSFVQRDLEGMFPDERDAIYTVQIDTNTWIRPFIYDDPSYHGLEWYLNHACGELANCFLPESGVVYAKRDIAVGEEILLNYATFELYDYISGGCLCGAAGCYGKDAATSGGFLSLSVEEKRSLYEEGWLTPHIVFGIKKGSILLS